MSIKSNKALILAFLNAVNTWKHLVAMAKLANKSGNKVWKSDMMKSMYHWRKTAEALKSKLDSLRLA